MRGALAEFPSSGARLEDAANNQAGERKVEKHVQKVGN